MSSIKEKIKYWTSIQPIRDLFDKVFGFDSQGKSFADKYRGMSFNDMLKKMREEETFK
tara:strand:+ start:37132 stop:37305 length:174 start_codon:yes stop_codon:yes gene_type:complete